MVWARIERCWWCDLLVDIGSVSLLRKSGLGLVVCGDEASFLGGNDGLSFRQLRGGGSL